MSSIKNLFRLLPSSGVLTLALLSGPAALHATAQDAATAAGAEAAAQSDTEAEQLLRLVADRLEEAGAFAADVELFAVTEQAFAQGMFPPAEGRYVMAADDEGQWRLRISGQAQPFGAQEMVTMDTLWMDREVTTIEPTLKKVLQGPPQRIKGTLFSTVRQLQAIPGIDQSQPPFSTLFDGRTSFDFGDTQTIDGVECQVVQTTAREGRRTEFLSIAIATTDQLPRRILRHPAGFEKGTAIGASFSNIITGEQAAAGQSWNIETPDGYEREVIKQQEAARPQQREHEQAEDGTAKVTRSATKRPEVVPSFPLSPKWQFQTREGDVISRDSLNGQTAVLYFWGTWCIPCRAAAPLNKQLWADYSEQKHFEMIGLAVRERDPEATYEYIAENGYEWTQLVGADKPAQLFEIRSYPTWLVIGPTGEVLYESSRAEGGDFEPIFAEIRKAVDKGLELSK